MQFSDIRRAHHAVSVSFVLVLVTGGAGFIGSNLVRRLLDEGDDVRILDDFSTGLWSNIEGLDVDVREGCLTDADSVARAVTDADSVVHLAARGSVPRSIAEPRQTHEVNATGTLNVLEAVREHGAQIIFSSSSSVYGSNKALPKNEDMWTQPLSPYGASKMAAESLVMSYREVYGLEALALRFFNVYGPLQRADHDYAAVIPKFVWAALNGDPLRVDGDGEQTRDFTHVNSVVSIIHDALRRRVSWKRPVNLAFGDRVSINELVNLIGEVIPGGVTAEHGPARAGDVRNSRNDPTLLRELFPCVEPSPLQVGLASVVEWFSETIRESQGAA